MQKQNFNDTTKSENKNACSKITTYIHHILFNVSANQSLHQESDNKNIQNGGHKQCEGYVTLKEKLS